MARRRKHQWPDKRLRELEKLFKRLTPSELVAHFGHPWEVLVQAHEFRLQHKRLLIETRMAGRRGKKYRITIYAPGYASGVKPSNFED